MPVRRSLVGIVALLLALVFSTGGAAAHGYQTGGDPPPYAALPEPPIKVVVHMSEPVEAEFSRIHVYDPTGRDLAVGSTYYLGGDESKLAVDVGIPGNGTYTVSWEARWRSDGHGTRGSYGFSVGNSTLDANFTATPGSEAPPAPEPGDIGLRGVLFAGVLLAVGSLGYLVLVDRGALPRSKTHAVGLAILASHLILISTFLILLLQTASGFRTGLLAAVLNLGRAIEATYLARVLAIRLLLGIALLATLVAALRYDSKLSRSAALLLALAMVPTLSLMSHAASVPEHLTLVVTADAVHVLAGAIWIGGLPLLVLALREARKRADPEAAARVTRRFSLLATGAVIVVAATGIYTSMVHLDGDWSRLLTTFYGKFLLAKILLVLILVAFGAYNQLVLVARTRRGSPSSIRRLGRTASAEIVVAALVVLAAGGLTAASPEPPRDPLTPGGPTTLTAEGNEIEVTLQLTPGRVGINEFNATITLLDNGTALTYAKNVVVFLNNPERPDLGTSQVQMDHAGGGSYVGQGSLGFSGTWEATVFVQRPDAYDDAAEFTIQI